MTIRLAKVADAPGIALVHVKSWQAAYCGQIPDAVLDSLDVHWRARFWRKRLADHHGAVFIAEAKHGIVGFCDLIPTRDEDADAKNTGEIAAIYVLHTYWRQGIGRALFQQALVEAALQGYKIVTLWVLATNSAAQAFYQTLGFSADGSIKTEKTKAGHELHEVRFRKYMCDE